jgi:Ca2+:H+ antiporter
MFMKFMLVFVPIAIVCAWLSVKEELLFVVACLAIVPLADQLAQATEELAEFLGPTVGGLLNATLGNAPELIIGGLALHKGLTEVVKSSIVGSILMNLLLTLGLAMVAGGIGRVRQKFNRTAAGMSAALLTLASIGLVVPALSQISSKAEEELSFEISLVLFLLYLMSLVFTLVTHKQLFASPVEDEEENNEHQPSRKGLPRVVAVLAVTAALLAVVSEIMTGSLEPAIKAMGLNETFAGVVVLGSLGNVAEMMAAIRFARGDKMDLAMGSTVGTATQAALAVAPILVFTGLAFGKPMDLQFSTFEVVALALAVLVTNQCTDDGESNWMEGAMLIGVYLMFAMGFFYMET